MFETMGWLKKSFSVLLSSLGHFSSDKDCFFFFFFRAFMYLALSNYLAFVETCQLM